MTMLYPIVLETEESGAVSAYVPGLPVYAAADTHAKAERAIRAVLAEYLNAHPASRPDARVRVARVPIEGRRESASWVLPLWWARSAATQRRGASRPMAGSAGALRRTEPHEGLGQRRRARRVGARNRPPDTIHVSGSQTTGEGRSGMDAQRTTRRSSKTGGDDERNHEPTRLNIGTRPCFRR